MKKSKGRIALMISLVALLMMGATICGIALDKKSQVEEKIKLIQRYAAQWIRIGKDPRIATAKLDSAKAAFDKGEVQKGETILDEVIQTLSAGGIKPDSQDNVLPKVQSNETTTDLYVHPESIEVSGYSEDLMEPCVSLDGQFLFFNNSNEPNVDTHIRFAKRVSDKSFQYIGLLPGVNSGAREYAPSLDLKNQIFFTSTRSYEKDLRTIYRGSFDGTRVIDVKSVGGDVSPTVPGWLNMDCCVSADGRTLIFSRAQFDPGAHVPHQSDLLIAQLGADREYHLDPQSARILQTVNTQALEYAPAISANGLELYFTRASEMLVGNKSLGAQLRIMVAKRDAIDKPFGEPQKIREIEGFVEAPTFSLDGKELFYHKKDGEHLRLYRVLRKK